MYSASLHFETNGAGMSYLCSLYCHSHAAEANSGVKNTNELGQMDATHYALVPQMLYLHVCTNIYSKFVWAVPQSSENASAVYSSLIQTFAVMGASTSITTEN